jgi:hypothetical protein
VFRVQELSRDLSVFFLFVYAYILERLIILFPLRFLGFGFITGHLSGALDLVAMESLVFMYLLFCKLCRAARAASSLSN